MLIMLFGLSGAGKNFVGEILRDYFGYTFWDADEVLSPAMINCIKEHRSFTPEMRIEYIKAINLKLHELKAKYGNLAAAQALYKEDYRMDILKEHPENILFLQIDTEREITIERVKSRYAAGTSPVDEKYAKQILGFFQKPSSFFFYMKLANNRNKDYVIKQLSFILGKKPSQPLINDSKQYAVHASGGPAPQAMIRSSL